MSTDGLSEFRRQIRYYRHLLSFERECLERMRGLTASRPELLRPGVESSDLQPMEALIEQFQQRLRYWQQRERELSSD
jgi:hypothetical protein